MPAPSSVSRCTRAPTSLICRYAVSHLIDDRSQRPLPGRSFDEVANGVGDDLRVPGLIAGHKVLEATEHLVLQISHRGVSGHAHGVVGRHFFPEHRRRVRPGLHDDRVDAQGGEFVPVSFCQRLECALRGCVGDAERKRCAGGNARYVHQEARSPAAHRGEHRAIDSQRPVHVCIEDLVNLLQRVRLEYASGKHPRVVHDRVEVIGVIGNSVNRRCHRFVVRDVHLQDDNRSRNRFRELVELGSRGGIPALGFAHGGEHRVAPPRERFNSETPKPTAAARNEDRLLHGSLSVSGEHPHFDAGWLPTYGNESNRRCEVRLDRVAHPRMGGE